MVFAKLEKDLFIKNNFHNIKIGKIYCHSEEWERFWGGNCQLYGFTGFCYHSDDPNYFSTEINFKSPILLVSKTLKNTIKRTHIVYTILFENKILYRYFHLEEESRILITKPILKLISG